MKGRFWKKTLSVCLALLMIAALIPSQLIASVGATSGVSYLSRSWDGSQVVTETKTVDCQDYYFGITDLNGWYYVNGYYEVSQRLNVTGTANIVILDGSTLLAKDGIHVPEGTTLNVYNTPGGENGTLECVADTNYLAAIGGNEDEACGTVNIYSGKVIAKADVDGAGIGGGDDGFGGHINIYGGTVNATGGSTNSDGGAGIGGGGSEWGGFITIYGGKVTAQGGANAAGIGGGDEGMSGDIVIFGGTVKATGGSVNSDGGAGIGGGNEKGVNNIVIYGGSVTAHGGCDAAGIGGGDAGDGGNITIVGNTTVNATGGKYGAGIGGGQGKGGGTIKINGAAVTVTAQGGNYGAGIGGGENGTGFTIELTNANVTATGGDNAAGIGGGDGGYADSIKITGGIINATGGSANLDGGAGIGGGNEKQGGIITITNSDVTAKGGADGAGIGGGDGGDGGTITITDGKVEATGGANGSGIGGGDHGTGGIIKINSGTVIANGGEDAAGIGGGENADGGVITINDGEVTATGGQDGAGIGGGGDGAASGGNGGVITINGGTVNATGGQFHKEVEGRHYNDGAAGIGGGYLGNGGIIKITDGEVTALGGFQAAGIGGGDGGSSGNITITGGKVRAKTLAYYVSWEHRTGAAAGIGDGMNAGGDPERIITISGGDIFAETTGLTREKFHGGAGIGSGYGGGGSENMKIIITGGKIEANGAPRAAGIGGGEGKYVGEISISGDADIIARGNSLAAAIGGGYEAKSGKITISGGKIEAIGGTSGAGIGSGSACTENNNAVDITINGGNIIADGGGRFIDLYTTNTYGSSIGAGGCLLDTSNNGDSVKDKSYFAGNIYLNGGTITAIQTIGTTRAEALDGAEGKVYFNGATVQIETNENYPSVMATTIIFKDEDGIRQKVSYADSGSGPYTVVPKDDRIPTLQAVEKKYVKVSLCEHDDRVYTDNGDNHTESCPHCKYIATQAHEYDNPIWSWAENQSSATATFTCEKCGHTEIVDSPVTWVIDGDGMATYTATARIDGKSYTDSVKDYADELGVRLSGHSISLDGDIGVNFYMELSDAVADSDTAYMHFTIPKNGEPDTQDIMVSDARQVESGDKTYYVFKCQVAAKEMTSVIKAQIIDGEKQGTVFTYSVKEYADYLIEHAEVKDEWAIAVPLVKAMLNYGAYTQIYFDKNPGKLANVGLTEEEKALGDVSIDVADYVVSGLPAGVTFGGATLSLKSETTLSLYFKSDSTLAFSCDGYKVETVKNGEYQVARIRGIKAAHIGDMLTLKVNGNDAVTYSPLNYIKKALNGGTDDVKLQNAVKALYLYWNAVESYFDNVNLNTLAGDAVVKDGTTIFGKLSGNHKISIADGATVRIRNADITSLANSTDVQYAGITLLGDATIILEGTNTVRGGYNQYPGIFVPEGKTLTIDGTGSLNASSNGYACGIGGGYEKASGNIIINGGNITATGGRSAAGIGGAYHAICGDITINGGNITAYGGSFAAGIGGGYGRSCGNITINDTVTQVTAIRGEGASRSIGAGLSGSGGTVTIGGVTGAVSESPYTYRP
ncbi:MAG: hypothetical protein IJI50_04260 [Ruminococcus sp.]|nr:hypothetical protein [Ruminococcus sp.]